MKPFLNLCVIAVLTLPFAVSASTYTKVDNTNSLEQAVSWGGVAPGSGDIANWSGIYSASVVTNSLRAILPGNAVTWQGITVGPLSGTALTTNTIAAAKTNLTAASELGNLVTITTKAAHAFAAGQMVTIAGVTPSGYNGTYIINGNIGASTFTYSNSVSGLTPGTAFGTVESAIYVGGVGAAAANSLLTIGSAGIDLSASTHSLSLNAASFAFAGDQIWNTAPGTIIHFSSSALVAANATTATSGSDGIITVSGGGIADLNEGGPNGFSDTGGFAGFTGKWIINSGATLRGVRSGGAAFGVNKSADAMTLNGGTLAAGGMSGDSGSWTWSMPIIFGAGYTSYIDQQIAAGTGRWMKFNQPMTGSGNITFKNTCCGAADTFTSLDLGFILAGANDFTGTLTISGPQENGIDGRLTPVRVGGLLGNGTDISTSPGDSGTLGNGPVVNNGILTFTRIDSLSIPNQISGTGTLRIGSAGLIGTAYQVITLSAVNTYTGPTIINGGTLALASTGSISDSSSITITTNTINDGLVINTFDVSALPEFAAAPGQTLKLLGGQVVGNLNLAAGSTNLFVPGGSNVVGSLAINGNLTLSGGSNTFLFDVNGGNNDQISVSGNLIASGATTLQFAPPVGGLNAGTYTLMTVGGTVTATPANFIIAGLVSGARPQSFSIVVNGNAIQLVVVGNLGNLTWVGDGVGNLWDNASTPDWFNTINFASDVFYAGDFVTFDDSGSGNPDINLTSSLAPGSLLVNASQNYAFSGAGQITGGTSLTKSGSGTLTLNTSNSFTGAILINGGTLAISNETALGAPTNYLANSLTLDGGSLLATKTFVLGGNTNRGINFGVGGGGGKFDVTNGATLTISNQITDSTGKSLLTKAGNGTLVLAGINTYGSSSGATVFGGTLIGQGTLVYGNGQALGRYGNTAGTTGYFAPPFELDNGIVDINGQSTYQPNIVGGTAATGTPVILYGATLTFNGTAGASMVLQDSGITPTGWGSSAATVLNYNALNNPGTLTINARFAGVGASAAATRTFNIGDSTGTTTEINIVAQMGVASLDPTNQDGRSTTILKTGSGTLQISAANNFPIVEVDQGVLRVNHPQALGTDRSISKAVSSGGSPNSLIITAGTVDLNGFSPAIGGLSDNSATTGLILNNGATLSTLTLGFSWSNTVFNATYNSIIADGTSVVALKKVGTNTQVLTGINTYSGPTTINNGTLVVRAPGQIGLGAEVGTVTVAGGTLGGSGTIKAAVVVQSAGTLAPGGGALTVTTLNLATNLILGGTNIMNVNKDTATNDVIVLAAGTINYGGTLVVSTNLMLNTTLALGDSFHLFSASNSMGNFSRISGSPGAGLGWRFDPASGVLSVVNGVASNPTSITASVSSGKMTFSWPQDHTGWTLEMQTNSLNVGLSTNWVVVPGSTMTNQITVPIDPSIPLAFYRLALLP
jgi:autotransporter-associated beta strand protein